MDDDLQIMIKVARAIVEDRWASRISDRMVMRALAHTVLLTAPAPVKTLKLAPTESDMAKIREQEPS